MKPQANARRMPAQSIEHSRTAASKSASKARRLARQTKHLNRSNSA